MRLIAALLALTTFFPANLTFATEEATKEIPAPVEEATTPEETAVEAETNVDYLNYLELEDFIISAERIPTNKWDTPANVTVITAQEIEDNHYQSVSEALQHVNGLVVGGSQIGGGKDENDSYSGLELTGGNRVLVLVDGHRWSDPQIGNQVGKSSTWVPSMKMIERIEVLRGGNSALYGSDAFNGIVNIITKKGTRNETTVDLNTGTWRRHRYEITNQGVMDKFSWFVTGSLEKMHPADYRSLSKREVWFDDVRYNTGSNNFSVRLDNRFNERSSLTFDVAHRSYRYREPITGEAGSEITNNISLNYNFKEGTSTPGWLRYINNYYTFTDYGMGNPNSRFQGVEYQNGWELGQHKIIAGLEWHKSSAKYPLYGYDADMTTKSFYLQDTIGIGEKWTIIPGFRYDHSNIFGGNWSPKIAVNYRPDEKTKIYASWGKSYNVPLLGELYAQVPESNDENYSILLREIARKDTPIIHGDGTYTQRLQKVKLGNHRLRPEKGNSFNIGIDHDFDEKSGISASFFYNKLNHSLSWFPEQSTSWNSLIWYTAANSIPIKNRGFEIAYRQKIDDHFSYNLGYSHTHSDFEAANGDIPHYRPQPNGYRIGLHYQNRGLKMNLLGVMASGINDARGYHWRDTDVLDAYPTKRYAILDFNLSYAVNDNATLYFKALNLTNQNYSNVESRYYDGYKAIHVSPGRQFIYGVDYRF